MITSKLVKTALPLERHWHDVDQPLPLREVRFPPRAQQRGIGLEAPPWLTSGPSDRPFDVCGHLRRLCADMVQRCVALRHIDVSRLLLCITQARTQRRFGLQARVTPLRFAGGQLACRRRGVIYQVQRYFVNRKEMLYLVTFCLPRFLEQSFDDKFITLFHELFHISPAFEGDLRRHAGRCDLHSCSKRAYDSHMALLAREYLSQRPEPALHGFLRLNFAQLQHRHGTVVGAVVPRPRLIPIDTMSDTRISDQAAKTRPSRRSASADRCFRHVCDSPGLA